MQRFRCSVSNPDARAMQQIARRTLMPSSIRARRFWQDHIVGWRVSRGRNQNIRSLAKELNLGLNGFIFIDDNPRSAK
jgi:predicted enzyme involved in methoxymalonyl-ACP biosynthesis